MLSLYLKKLIHMSIYVGTLSTCHLIGTSCFTARTAVKKKNETANLQKINLPCPCSVVVEVTKLAKKARAEHHRQSSSLI